MKRIARLVGGVLIVLLLSIALVSCDDDLLQHIQNGTQNEAQNGTQNNEQNEEQDEAEDEDDESEDEDEESDDEDDVSEDEDEESEDDEFNGLPRKGDFTYIGTPPTNHAAIVEASNEIKEEMERIKRELDHARENTETIDDISVELFKMMGNAFKNFVVDYENDGYAGMEVFSVLLEGVDVESVDENALLQVDADSVKKSMFTRTLFDESDSKSMETKVGMSAEFEIVGSEMGIDGEYKIKLLMNVEGDDEEQEVTLVGTLTNIAEDTEDTETPLTEADLLLGDDEWYEWDQEGAYPHQRTLTLFMEIVSQFDMLSETLATQIFYPEITGDDGTGKFIGLVSFYQEGDAAEEEIPLYLAPMYLSFLWEGTDHEKYYVVYSSHEDYQTIVAINGVAYNFALP